jgi:hypothetical protein
MLSVSRRDFLKASCVTPCLPLAGARAGTLVCPSRAVAHLRIHHPRGSRRRQGRDARLAADPRSYDYQQSLENTWKSNAAKAELTSDGQQGAKMLMAVFNGTEGTPYVELTSRIRTQSRSTTGAAR